MVCQQKSIEISDLIFQATENRSYVELGRLLHVPSGTIRKIQDMEYRPTEKTLARLLPGLAKINSEGVARYVESKFLKGTGLSVRK